MTPPLKVTGISTSASFPEGVTEIDLDVVEEIFAPLESKFFPPMTGLKWGRERGADFGARLLGDGHYRGCTRLKETVISDAVDLPLIGTKVDVSVEKGARICADFETKKGILSWPNPITLQGFSAWGIRPDRALLKKDGHLEMETGCCLSTDVTDMVLQSPIGPLFPDKKITDLPLKRFFLFEFPPPAHALGKGQFSQAILALDLTGFWGEVCTDPLCAGPKAGLALYLDPPLLRETLETGGFKSFDLNGILKDSFVDWPNFPLTFLPLPPGVEIPEGRADLSARYDPDTKTTSIGINNIDAKILIPDLFEREPVHLSGGLTLTLQAGGKIQVHFSSLKIEIPSLPSKKYDWVSFSSVISGDLIAKWDPKTTALTFQEAHLSFDSIDLKTDPGRGIRMSQDGIAFGLSLQGSVGIDYVPSDPTKPLVTRWSLQGSAPLETARQALELRGIRFEGKGSWQKIRGRFVPNLYDFEAGLSTDLYRREAGKENLVAKGLGFQLKGKGTDVVNGVSLQKATLTAGAESVQIGGLKIVPSLKLDLTRTDRDKGFRIDGVGNFSATALTPKLQVGAQLHLTTTDLRNFDWKAAFADEQILGGLTANGEMKIDGRFGFTEPGSLLKSFKITTAKPYEIRANGVLIEKRMTVTGRGAKGDSLITLRAPSLLGRARVSIDLYDFPWRDRLLGRYRIRPRPISEGRFLLKDIVLNGKFVGPSFSEIFEKKRVALAGSVKAEMEGAFSGPISSDYQASLRWSPSSSAFLLAFRSDKASEIRLGPILAKNEKTLLEGEAKLQGTLIARYGGGRISLGGDNLGIREGKVFIGLEGPILVDERGQKIPALDDLSFTADRLDRIQNGVAYCGGRRCRLEARVNLRALKLAVDPDRSQLPIFKTPHRVQLSPAAWWAEFKRYVLGKQ